MKNVLKKMSGLMIVSLYVCLTVIVVGIIALIHGPTIEKTHHHFDSATVLVQLNLKDNPKQKAIYISDSSENSQTYQDKKAAICEVNSFKEYPLNKKLDDFTCTFKKKDIGKKMNIEKSSMMATEG